MALLGHLVDVLWLYLDTLWDLVILWMSCALLGHVLLRHPVGLRHLVDVLWLYLDLDILWISCGFTWTPCGT